MPFPELLFPLSIAILNALFKADPSFYVVGVVVVGAVPLMLVSELLGAQHGDPSIRKDPPEEVVLTQTEYRVLVRREQAVTCAQFLFVRGYSSVPVPIVTKTGALMVVVSGIDCATTIQYLQLLL